MLKICKASKRYNAGNMFAWFCRKFSRKFRNGVLIYCLFFGILTLGGSGQLLSIPSERSLSPSGSVLLVVYEYSIPINPLFGPDDLSGFCVNED